MSPRDILTVEFRVQDCCNPSDTEAKTYLINLIESLFIAENLQKYPRVKLISVVKVKWEYKP